MKSIASLSRRQLLAFGASAAATALPLSQALAQAGASNDWVSQGSIKLAMIEGLSGVFALTGEAVYRNLLWAVERVNQAGGVKVGAQRVPLSLIRYDSKGQTEEALNLLKIAIDDGARVILQGNSSAVAAALIAAVSKHNDRDPARQALFLNYSAVEPSLTNALCSPWHFRFDAHADMRLAALMRVLRDDKAAKKAYLIGQDYSFGQAVVREAKKQLAVVRPDIEVVGEVLHPMARVKDFLPYATQIVRSGAQVVITGNWGSDLTLLVKAAKEAGYTGSFYTFYGNALGAPAAIGDAGVGKVLAVAEWFPNMPGEANAAFYQSFRKRFPNTADDYVHMRMNLLVQALAQAIEGAGLAVNAASVAQALEKADVTLAGHRLTMRAEDHQAQQPLVVAVMDKQGKGVKFDVEGSGYGFKPLAVLNPQQASMPHTCAMR